jgi:16S rRNA (guanine527-N7)-methyltransferase
MDKKIAMELGGATWNRLIQEGGAQLGVAVSEAQLALLTAHAALLLHWNRKTNLTAITDPAGVAIKHVVDCLAPLPLIPDAGRLLDIGSGGGFPGLVLKIMRPALQVSLIDAARKKVSFLAQAIRNLGLKDIAARHIRAEALGKSDPPERFDIITCRALCALIELVPLARPLLTPEGRVIAMKGRRSETEIEIDRLSQGDAIFRNPAGSSLTTSVQAYTLPHEETERTLVILQFCSRKAS